MLKFNRILPNIKRYSLFFLICLLPLQLFTSCAAKKKEKGRIEFWTLSLSPFFDEYITGLIREFERQNPGATVKWTDIPYDAALQKLLAAYASGAPPDVVNLSTDFLAKFNRRNLFLNLKTVIPKDSLRDLYLPYALSDCTYAERIIAVPWYLSTYCVIYNKALLKQAGYTEADIPKSFSDAIKFIRDYKNRTGKYAFFWNIGKDSYLPMMLGSEGIDLLDSTLTKSLLNSELVISKLQEWVNLYKEGYLPRESVTVTGSTIVEPFQSGSVAFIFTGPVFLKRIKDNAPNIYKETGISAPLLGQNKTHELAAMSLSVSAGSAEPDLATKFCLFVTNHRNQLEFCKKATIYPSVNSALTDSFFTQDDGLPESIARTEGAKLLPSAKRLRRYLLHPQHDKLQQILEEAIQEACLTNKTLRETIQAAHEEWSRLLKRK